MVPYLEFYFRVDDGVLRDQVECFIVLSLVGLLEIQFAYREGVKQIRDGDGCALLFGCEGAGSGGETSRPPYFIIVVARRDA